MTRSSSAGSKPTARQVAAGLCAALTLCVAQQGLAQSTENIRGKVREFTTAPRGEIDGAVLENGTILHWPPHLEERFQAVAAVGDQVEAAGITETGPRGDTHFEVTRLTNSTTGEIANNDREPPPPRGRRGRNRNSPIAVNSRTIEGVVRSVTTAPRGEVDGAILDNGTTLHWPPHLQDRFANLAAVGERVTATGQSETAPRGEVRFEVDSLKNERAGATSGGPPAAAPAGAVDREARLRAIEQRLLDIQREIEQLKQAQ
jgi:hypothetical protein